MKTTLLSITSLAVLIACLGFHARGGDQHEADAEAVAHHWEVVEHYRRFIRDPSNYRPDPRTGFSVTSPPDPLPSLAALVSANEIEHVDLVLPVVPYNPATTRFWLEWAEDREDILHGEGNPEYGAFKPAGQQPLHLKLWFRPSATEDIQQLIRDLEAMAQDGN